MNPLLANAFVDELEKLSGRSMTRKQVYRAFNHIAPGGSGASLWKEDATRELKRGYREALKHSGPRNVDLATRLKSYKHWKRTGKVPEISQTRGGKWAVNKGGGREASYTRSNEPITVYSGGSAKGLQKARKNPMAEANTDFILPGSTKVHRRTMWATPQKSSAEAYAGMGRTLTGKRAGSPPAVASITLPKKYVATRGSGQEIQISPEHLRRAKIKIERAK